MRKAKISHEDAVYWSSPLKQWESSRCIVLIVDPTPSSLANPFIFTRHYFLEFSAKSGKKSSKIRRKNAKFEVFAIELMNIH